MIIYFTGTGNSRLIAETMALNLGDELLDSLPYIKNQEKAIIDSQKPLVFVAPTYGWQLPHIFVDFIKTLTIEGNRDAYFLMTCGDSIGDASSHIDKLCKEVGLHYRGVARIVMPENYIAMFSVPDIHESDCIIEKALFNLQGYMKCIKDNRNFPLLKTGFIDKRQSGIVNTVFYKFFIKDYAFVVSDDCISCGLCAKKCPMNNIEMVNGFPQWNHDCTHCMACICYCPKEAIEYGKKSKGKRRYYCEVEKWLKKQN